MGISVTPHDQTNRLLRIDTALGKDALIAVSLTGMETMSEGFEYRIEVFSEKEHDIPPETIIGTPATVMITQDDNTPRVYHGYVAEIHALGRHYGGQRSNYQLTLVPWLWFLSKSADCRVFQEMTVEDVLKALFEPLGDKAKFKFKLTKSHPRHRFLVQYNETSLNVLYRLLRREGIAFYIEHDQSGHTVHFVDDAASLPDLSPATLQIGIGQAAERLTGWRHASRFVTGRYAERSYNYKDPNKVQIVESQVAGPVAELPGALDTEQYQYTEDYDNPSEGKATVHWRQEQGVERHEVIIGSATYRHLMPGHHFTAEQVPAGEWPDHGKAYTLSRVSVHAVNVEGGIYRVDFEAFPKGALAYSRDGRRPRISGLQTAVVTGPAGEEIYTDRLGRIKVQFHWDRNGKHDENTTCWLRVMQSFAGPDFGSHFTPRIGQEVVVAFENGNPERPFVIGALYHPEQAPPYSGEPTRSGIKTRSTKGGGPNNANEIRFDDKSGGEELYVQAEKDLEVLVKNNEKRTVNNDLEIEVKNNASIKSGNEIVLHAAKEIKVIVGGSVIKIDKSGIKVGGKKVDIDGGKVEIN